MGPGAVITVPPASAHSYDHAGWATDLVVAGALGAILGAGVGGRAPAVVATRDEHSIPALAAGPPPPLAHLAALARSVAGGDVVVGSTAQPAVADHARTAWDALAARGVLARGVHARPRCSRCGALPDATATSACEGCGSPASPGDGEPNWFLRVAPFADGIAAFRERVALRGPAAALGRASAAPPATLSVSRPASRTGGHGVPVPGDPGQVIHSGFVAAASYLAPRPDAGWAESATRIQVLGKGLLNLHLTLVPLLCQALDAPTADVLHVHHHLRVEGRSPREAAAAGITASALVERHGPTAVRWGILRLALARRDASLLLRDLAALGSREAPRVAALAGSGSGSGAAGAGTDASETPGPHGDPAAGRRTAAQLAALDLGGLTRSLLAAPDRGGLDAVATGTDRARLDSLVAWVVGAGARP